MFFTLNIPPKLICRSTKKLKKPDKHDFCMHIELIMGSNVIIIIIIIIIMYNNDNV